MAKHVRDVLQEMGLPPESIERALQDRGLEGDVNEIAAYALSLNNPQAECIEEHLSDVVSSDEDAGSDLIDKWRAEANKMELSVTQAPLSEGKKLQALSHEPEVSAVKVEEESLEPQVNEEKEAGANVEGWEDPICKILKSIKQEDLSDEAEISKGKETVDDPQPSEEESNVTAVLSNFEKRQASFRDMGFSTELIQRAIQLHGTEADDSTLLQFLLDWRENDGPKICESPNEESDSDLADEEVEYFRKNAPALVNKNPKTSTDLKEKHVAMGEPNWDTEDPYPLDDDANEAIPFGKPAPLCRREAPTGGHRHLMRSHGFSDDLIDRAIKELGEGVEIDMLLEYLLYLVGQQDQEASTSELSSCPRVSTVEKLVAEFQYERKAVERAMEVCETPLWDANQDQICVLVDFLAAHGEDLDDIPPLQEESDYDIDEEIEDASHIPHIWDCEKVAGTAMEKNIKRKPTGLYDIRPKRPREYKARPIPSTSAGGETLYKGAEGFGLPGKPVRPRYLSEDVKGAPFFYFENVASMPKNEWERIKRHLFDVEPEFVDSLHFSACRRPRGYIHNLPLEGRKKIIPDPPMTIQELMPQTKAFWPAWDPRTKLNCINTQRGGEFLAKRMDLQEGCALQPEHPSPEQQRNMLHWCRRWNLVWTAPSIPTPVNEHEIEAVLGFDRDHTRNCLGTSERYKALGNSFSVFTVAYHFSVLRPLYPRGIKVLSLFSGIGGAEVALHKLGIKLLVVVSIEISKGARRCVEAWWASSKQTGILNQSYHDVKDLGREELAKLVNEYKGFDLIVGGSPCNNLSANNRCSRTGLDGPQSTVFFEFSRIVAAIRELSINLQP